MAGVMLIILTVAIAAFVAFIFLSKCKGSEDAKTTSSRPAVQQVIKKQQPKPKAKLKAKTSQGNTKKKRGVPREKKSEFLLHTPKSHGKQTTCAAFSADGRYVAVANDAGRIHIYSVETLGKQERYHLIKDIEYDFVTALSFHADGTVLVAATSETKQLRFYTVPALKSNKEKQKRFAEHVQDVTKDGRMHDIQTGHTQRVSSVIFASTGVKPYIATCACGDDTTVKFFNLRGKRLANLDTKQIRNYMMAVSSDSNFIAVANWTSEVKVIQVKRDKKTKLFDKAVTVMALKGHGKRVRSLKFGFYPKGRSHIVTASADGTLALWETAVRYEIGEDPKRLRSHKCGKDFVAVALSPDGQTIAAAKHGELHFYDAVTGDCLRKSLTDGGSAPAPAEDGEQTWLEFLSDGSAVLLREPSARSCHIWAVPPRG